MANRPHATKKLLFPCQAEVSRSLVRFKMRGASFLFPPYTRPPHQLPSPGFPPPESGWQQETLETNPPGPLNLATTKGNKQADQRRNSDTKHPIQFQGVLSSLVAADPPVNPRVYPVPCFFPSFLSLFFCFLLRKAFFLRFALWGLHMTISRNCIPESIHIYILQFKRSNKSHNNRQKKKLFLSLFVPWN